MNLLIYANAREDGEEISHSSDIMTAFEAGARIHHINCDRIAPGQFDGFRPGFDLVAYCGMDLYARKILDTYTKKGVRVLLIDKGLIRNNNKSDHNRVCIDCATPNKYLMRHRRPDDRWRSLYQPLWPQRVPIYDHKVLYCNNSQGVHDFWGLGNAQAYTEKVIYGMQSEGRHFSMVYRPKRSLEYRSMHRVRMSLPPATIEDALRRTRLLITYGSSCAINAVMRGIPVVALGPCPTDPVCPNKTFSSATNPVFPSDEKRYQWLSNLAYAQWSRAEFSSGAMLQFILGEIRALNAARDAKKK